MLMYYFLIFIMFKYVYELLIYFVLVEILQLKHHKPMWYNGQKFHVKRVDDTKKTANSRITAMFQVTNVSSRSDKHLRLTENRYYGYLDDIIEFDFKSFKIIMFEVKWYHLQINECDFERTAIQHDNGFTMVNTRTFEPSL